MEAALYDPEYGYYTSGRHRIGFDGDYFTSPSLSPAFGRTLARLLPVMDDLLNKPEPFHILELGAGEGVTAKWVMDALHKDKPGLFNRIKYICVEQHKGGFETRPYEKNAVGARHAMQLQPSPKNVEWMEDIFRIEPFSGVV
jgi:SAM-dependent MidA family methyltransferase